MGARTVYGGHEHVLRQTLIALAAGHKLDEHENPDEATVHVCSPWPSTADTTTAGHPKLSQCLDHSTGITLFPLSLTWTAGYLRY